MSLSSFDITKKWPAQNPDILQLYSLPTPNGVKVSIMLEELGLPYEAHRVPFGDDGVMSPEYLSLNPNNKIPAILDPNGPDGAPQPLFESGAILIYLAEKTGKFLGETPQDRIEVLQWLMFQMGGVGPMFGQLGFFYANGGKDFQDKRPLQRYLGEAKRLLNVLNGRLEGRDWIAGSGQGSYSIADIAIAPWLNAIGRSYDAVEATGLESYPHVTAYIDRFLARPAVGRGYEIPAA